MLEKKEESKEIVTTLITNFLVIFLGFYFSFNYRTSNLFKLYGELIIGMGDFCSSKTQSGKTYTMDFFYKSKY